MFSNTISGAVGNLIWTGRQPQWWTQHRDAGRAESLSSGAGGGWIATFQTRNIRRWPASLLQGRRAISS